MNYSNTKAAQDWLNQFLSEDKDTARRLLEQLVCISTDNVLNALTARVSKLVEGHDCSAIIPVRELKESESYFDIEDDCVAPKMQFSDRPLGSEAFASNLTAQVSRRHNKKVISQEGLKLAPSIKNLRDKRVDSLILVDDLIGSGTRTIAFLDSLYQHPTIKSWLSGNHIKLEIVSYMASDSGKKAVEKWCRKRKNIELSILNKCPMLDLDEQLISLCTRYADKGERSPISFGKEPVSVVFSHSAPNNLPAILYRSKHRLKTSDNSLRSFVRSWKALFPSRSVPDSLKHSISLNDSSKSLRQQYKALLSLLEKHQGILEDQLVDAAFGDGSAKTLLIRKALEFKWISIRDEFLFLTLNGQRELDFLRRAEMIYYVANNVENYYPSYMSRANGHFD